MALPRFFCPIPLTSNSLITLPREAAHHAGRSLRLREGTRIVLFNGEGGEYQGTLRFNQGIAQAEIDSFCPDNRTLTGKITLIQALASGDKMDWIIEKAVEIGVDCFIPVAAERSVLQLSGARLEKRQQHWQSIIQSACEQSGRNILMELLPVQTLKQVLEAIKQTHFKSNTINPENSASDTPAQSLLFIAHPDGNLSLSQYLRQTPKVQHIGFFIGPEGGWSEKEIQTMEHSQAIKVQFGDRVLRTETAGLALSSASAALLQWV